MPLQSAEATVNGFSSVHAAMTLTESARPIRWWDAHILSRLATKSGMRPAGDGNAGVRGVDAKSNSV